MNSTQTARLAPANYRVYSVSYAGHDGVIALDQIYQACVKAGLEQSAASVARLQRDGSRYSGGDGDVLSAALAALRTAGVDTFQMLHAHVYNNCQHCNATLEA